MPAVVRASFPKMTFDEFLRYEERAVQKHEFHYGVVYAMDGGLQNHSFIAAATTGTLDRLLLRKKCAVATSDLMIETPNQDAGFYPDVSVICRPTGPGSARTQSKPTLVVEVLSPSTRAHDLTTKLKEYMLIPSLRHLLYIDSEKIEARLYSRGDRNTWLKDPQLFASLADEIALPALGIKFKLRSLYRTTDLV